MVDNLPVLPLDLFPLTIKWKQLEALLTTCALPMVSGGWHRSRCYCLDTKRGLTKNMTPHIDLSHPRCGALGRVLHIQKGWDNDLLTPAIIIPEMINYPRVLVSFYRRQEFLEISCPTLNYCCCCCCSWCCCSLATEQECRWCCLGLGVAQFSYLMLNWYSSISNKFIFQMIFWNVGLGQPWHCYSSLLAANI